MNIEHIKNFIYITTLIIFSIYLLAIFLRALLGPKVTDRIICINMIGTKVIIMICIVAAVLHEDYLVDVAIVYALINFVSMVVLTQSYGYVYRKSKSIEYKGGTK